MFTPCVKTLLVNSLWADIFPAYWPTESNTRSRAVQGLDRGGGALAGWGGSEDHLGAPGEVRESQKARWSRELEGFGMGWMGWFWMRTS